MRTAELRLVRDRKCRIVLLGAVLFAAMLLPGEASPSHHLTDPVPAELIVVHNGLEWVWASPCTSEPCSTVVLHDGFRYATATEWADRPDVSLFEGKCASPYFDIRLDHCDPLDLATGLYASGPGNLGPACAGPFVPICETLLVRGAGTLPAAVTVAPVTDTNRAGEQHCVTATVTDAGGNALGGVTVFFTVTGANAATGTIATDAAGHAVFCYTGTHVGTDTIRAVADTNASGAEDAGDTPPGTATKVYVAAVPTTVTVTPATATNVVGSQHCVTATATDAFGNATPNVTVYFTVTGTTTARDTSAGSALTGASGQAQFCYTAQFPGADTIHAVADANGSGTAEATEPAGTATKTYVLPVGTQSCPRITVGGWIVAANGDRATFGGMVDVSLTSESRGKLVYRDHGPAQRLRLRSTTVLAVVCTAEGATIYGTGTVNGSAPVSYRIELTDAGGTGEADAYGILISTGYYSGEQPLQGGNITLHTS